MGHNMRENIKERVIHTEWKERWMERQRGDRGEKEGLKEEGKLCCISSDAEVNGSTSLATSLGWGRGEGGGNDGMETGG